MGILFDVTADDIAGLNDDALRELVGLLCQADYRKAGLPVKDVTFGGHQDAKDGGFDVFVNSEFDPPAESFIPKKFCGIQVKKPNMTPSKITTEMMPDGTLRSGITALETKAGAYLLISSGSNTSDSALNDRIKKMKECLGEHQTSIAVDFLDSGRIATWVRMHPSLILWVRNNVGRELRGWHSYDNWAGCPDGLDDVYLIDDGLRISDSEKHEERDLSAVEGLNKIRQELSVPGTSVRLAGLSGFGKTRFVQALFDNRIGEHALPPEYAYYADVAPGIDPDPVSFAKQLILAGIRAVLVIDNCPPDLHKQVSQTCTASNSPVSLISVEYDVRDDLPNETEVFRLVAASEELIVKLIKRRFPNISQVDVATIARFSGGNARIAIALANTMERGDTLSGMRDDDLFRRLFQQRNDSSDTLLASAEAASLVYSFEGTQTSEGSELAMLAALIGTSPNALFRDVMLLKARELVQTRGVWRAVLPHAIANQLAKNALKTIPKDFLIENVLSCGNERLILSFSRRLHYLHDCVEAIEIAKDFISENGWLGNVRIFSALQMEIFANLAPLVPALALQAIERSALADPEGFVSRGNRQYYNVVKLLRSLAYDEESFERPVGLLIDFALAEQEGENFNSVPDILRSLFFMRLSGTQANEKQRSTVIISLLKANSSERTRLGLELLKCTLEAWHFTSHYDFTFGARPRNYGYYPKSDVELKNWYNTFLEIAWNIIEEGGSNAEFVKQILGEKFRGLWTFAEMFDELEILFTKIHIIKPWPAGWAAVRQAIRFEGDAMPPEAFVKLTALERMMRPIGLKQLVETYALSRHAPIFDLLEDDDEPLNKVTHFSRAQEITEELGLQLSQNIPLLEEMSNDLLSTNGAQLFTLGEGLAQNDNNRFAAWKALCKTSQSVSPEKFNISVMSGFLHTAGKLDLQFIDEAMQDVMNNFILSQHCVRFQCLAGVNEKGLSRLNELLEKRSVPTSSFQFLAYGRAHEVLRDEQLAELLEKLLSLPDSIAPCIEILRMRIHMCNEQNIRLGVPLARIARIMLASLDFDRPIGRDGGLDHELASIVSHSMIGNEAASYARKILENMAHSVAGNSIYIFNFYHVLGTLAKVQPESFLDVFLEGSSLKDRQKQRLFTSRFERDDNPLREIEDSAVLAWCEKNPSERYALAANVIDAFALKPETQELEWRSIFFKILEKAPNFNQVIEAFENNLTPTSYNGSLSDILQQRVNLLETLFEHENSGLFTWAKRVHSTISQHVVICKQNEAERRRLNNETFE